MNRAPDDGNPPSFVQGDATGLLIPAHIDALAEAGVGFLTEAFHIFGSLSRHNRVKRITRFEKCAGGSTGSKLILSLEYEKTEPGLHSDLFVKFSRDFADEMRDNRGKYEMESEIRFAAAARRPGFPIEIPQPYFADFNAASYTGLLITERVPFGIGPVEPQHEKACDHQIEDPVSYYRTIVKSLARISGAHKAGRLSSDIDTYLPFNPQAAAEALCVSYGSSQLQADIQAYRAFAITCANLLPPDIRTPEFIDKLHADAARFLDEQRRVANFLQANPDYIALSHWNANIDNAWFWRGAAGELHCGLMDWGNVRPMNVAFALWGALSAAHHDIWHAHLDELLLLFVEEYHLHGGPLLKVQELRLHLKLYMALMALQYWISTPARVLFRLPEAPLASGPLDPMIQRHDSVRNQVHNLTAIMQHWRREDFGRCLDLVLQCSRSGSDSN